MSAVSSVIGCFPYGSRCGNIPNELVYRAVPPFLGNHYLGYQKHTSLIQNECVYETDYLYTQKDSSKVCSGCLSNNFDTKDILYKVWLFLQ